MTNRDAALVLQDLAAELEPVKPVAARAARLGAQALFNKVAGSMPEWKEKSRDGPDERVPRLR